MLGFVGGDASKGYADFCVVDGRGQILAELVLDDTAAGHQSLRGLLAEMIAGGKATAFVGGLESSGGVERNWLCSLRKAAEVDQVVQLNPLLVKHHRERKLHRSVTDKSSARTIAEVLRTLDLNRRAETSPELEEARRLSQHIHAMTAHCGRLKTELQGLLVNSHPELVRHCRNGLPKWILCLLTLCPTSDRLAAANPNELAEIRYITSEKAHALVSEARKSVRSATGPLTELLVLSLVSQIKQLTKDMNGLQERLSAAFKDDRTTRILTSVPGIALKTAQGLSLAYGNFARFHSEAAIIAYAGLDARVHQSGDVEKHQGISRRGRSSIRRLMFFPAMAAIRTEPRFRTFYDGLVARGKPTRVAMVAVMAKLLRVAYACVLKDQPYDANYVTNPTIGSAPYAKRSTLTSLTAPTSRRETKRRKKAAASAHHEVKPH